MQHFREAEPQLASKLEQSLRDFSEGRAGALPAEPAVGGGPDGTTLLGTETDGIPSAAPAIPPLPAASVTDNLPLLETDPPAAAAVRPLVLHDTLIMADLQ